MFTLASHDNKVILHDNNDNLKNKKNENENKKMIIIQKNAN